MTHGGEKSLKIRLKGAPPGHHGPLELHRDGLQRAISVTEILVVYRAKIENRVGLHLDGDTHTGHLPYTARYSPLASAACVRL